MANKVKIELNSQGIRELLKSDEVKAVCEEQANLVAQRAGDGYAVESRNYPERSGFAIKAETPRAYYDNLKNNTLLGALQ